MGAASRLSPSWQTCAVQPIFQGFDPSVSASQVNPFRPPLAEGYVPRPRLCAALGEGLSGRLLLVCAPAGSGKSSLAVEFCRHLPAHWQSLWLALDRRDAEPGRLLERLLITLSRVLPGFGARSMEMLRLRQPHQPFAFEGWLDGMLDDLATHLRPQQPVLLVMDDYHLAQGAVSDSCLQYLLDHLPAGICLLVCSRQRPAWHLARLRLGRQVMEVGEGELRMNHSEVRDLFGTALADDDELGELLARSEGWVAGLRLWQWMRERTPADRLGARIHGGEGAIRDYLLEEVIERQPLQVQAFLQATAHLERFCASLCDQVREAHDSAALIEHLRTHQLFLVPLDEQHQWFRYHHLFSDLLRARPLPPSLSLSSLHLRACRWFAEHGQSSEAVEEALRAGRVDVAASLVQSLSEEQLLAEQNLSLLLRWKMDLPDTLLSSTPRLIFLYGWALVLACQLDAADDLLASLDRFLPAPSAAQQRSLLAQWLALSGVIARARGELSRARRHCEDALGSLSADSYGQRLMCLSSLAGQTLAAGEMLEARTFSREALELSQRIGNPLLEALIRCERAAMLAYRGEFRRAQEEVRNGLACITDASLQHSYASRGRLALLEGELLFSRAELAPSRARLRQGIEESRACRDLAVLRGYACLARIEAGEGRPDMAFALLAEAESLMHAWDVPAICYLAFITLCKCELWLQGGRLELAEPWLLRLRQTYCVEGAAVPELTPQLALEIELQYALLRDQQGAAGDALDLLDALQQRARRMSADALALQIGLERVRLLLPVEQGRARQLLRALDSKVCRDHRQPFFCLVRRLPYLAEELSQERLPADVLPGRGERSGTVAEEPLSAREQAVLQLIAQGLSNQQISERLFISLPTVKTHARNINAKLGVQRRTQAVAHAKQLGLLT